MMRVTALLLLSSVAIVGSAAWSAAWAQTDGSRQIVIEEKDKDKDTKKAKPAKEAAEDAEPAREEAKDEAPAKEEVKEEINEAEPAKEEAEEKPAKAIVKEDEGKPADVIVKEEADKPADVIVKEEADKPAKALVKGKEEVIVKEAVKEEPPLVIVLQTELKRVGCYHGQIDGEWGPGSSEALADFYHYGKVSISKFDPTPDALALVKGKKGVVCLAHDSPQDDYGEYGSDGGYGGGGGYSDGY